MHASSKHPVLTALGALLLLALLAGCSGGGSATPFAACGDGHLDAGEQCDDGNLSDNDDCLSTCVRARCGDSFINILCWSEMFSMPLPDHSPARESQYRLNPSYHSSPYFRMRGSLRKS